MVRLVVFRVRQCEENVAVARAVQWAPATQVFASEVGDLVQHMRLGLRPLLIAPNTRLPVGHTRAPTGKGLPHFDGRLTTTAPSGFRQPLVRCSRSRRGIVPVRRPGGR